MSQFTVTHTNKAMVQALPRADVNIPQQKVTVAFEHKLARHGFHTQCYTETCASAKHHRLFIMEMLAATRTHLQSVGQLTPELSKKLKLKALQIRRAIERNDQNDTYLKDLSDIRSWRSFQCKE